MHIKAVNYQTYMFLPTVFVLQLNLKKNIFYLNGKKFRVGTKKGSVGSPEPDIVFFSPYH